MTAASLKTKTNERSGVANVRSLYPVEFKTFTPDEQIKINDAFPDIDPGVIPNGNRILIQMRAPKKQSAGGILLPENMSTSQLYEEQIGRVVAIGSSAFHSQTTMTPWPEGEPFSVGDFVRVPKFGGERLWQKDDALFEIVRDFDVIGVVLGNPLNISGYL